jgi:hypothetical protein
LKSETENTAGRKIGEVRYGFEEPGYVELEIEMGTSRQQGMLEKLFREAAKAKGGKENKAFAKC